MEKGNAGESNLPVPARRSVRVQNVNPVDLGGAGSPEQGQDLRAYWRIIVYRRWLIIFTLLVFALLGVFQLKRSVPVYSATAVIKYEPRAPQVVDFGERSSILYQRDEIATAVQLIRSPAVAERVLRALNQAPPAPVQDTSPVAKLKDGARSFLSSIRSRLVTTVPVALDDALMSHQAAVNGLLHDLRAYQRMETKLIEITYSGADPVQTAHVANEFCYQFIESINQERDQSVNYARDFLDRQIQETKLNLQEAEQRVYEMRAESELRAMDENIQIAVATMTDLIRETERTRNEIALLEAESKAAEDETNLGVLLMDDGFFGELRQRLSQLEIERNALAANNSANFPPIQRLEREISSVKEQMAMATDHVATTAKARLNVARLRLDSLEDRLEEHKTHIGQLEELMIPYRVLTREVESSRTIFANLLDQYKRLEVSDDVAANNVSIVSRANIPTLPTSPNVTRTLGLFGFMGLFIGVAMAMLLHWSDRSVKSAMLVEEMLGLPTLGFVPFLGQRKRGFLPNRKQKKSPILLRQESKMVQAEAFHYLRTSIQYSSPEHPPQVILVTSCLPQEGKSTVSSNLSIFFAGRGQKTLMIDADLKRPMVHKIFQITRMPGLTDVLTGQVELKDAIVPSGHANLDILPAGLSTPAPINLLESEAMAELLERLRKDYATIILDSAPCHGMADSLVLANRSDGVCLVVRQNGTLTEVLEKTANKLRTVGANIFGVIYNATEEQRETGEGYGYGYGYGYTYRYEAQLKDEKEEQLETTAKRISS